MTNLHADRLNLYAVIERYKRERGVTWEHAWREVAKHDKRVNGRELWRDAAAFFRWQRYLYETGDIGIANAQGETETAILEIVTGNSEGYAVFEIHEALKRGFHVEKVDALRHGAIDGTEGKRDKKLAKQLNGTPAGLRITARSGTPEGERDILRYLRGHEDGSTKAGDAGADRTAEGAGARGAKAKVRRGDAASGGEACGD